MTTYKLDMFEPNRIEDLYYQRKILEGDIIKDERDESESCLVLLVIGPNSIPSSLNNVYLLSQNDREQICLSTTRLPIEFFFPGTEKYNRYKSMLQNSELWNDSKIRKIFGAKIK